MSYLVDNCLGFVKMQLENVETGILVSKLLRKNYARSIDYERKQTAVYWDYQVGGHLLRLTFQSDSYSESNGFENSVWASTLMNCYLVLRYLENNTELENSLKDIQMPSKKLGSITVGGYSKFKNVLLFFSTLPSPSKSLLKEHDKKDECRGYVCSYLVFRSIENIEKYIVCMCIYVCVYVFAAIYKHSDLKHSFSIMWCL